jgi:hypothetical protein
MKRSVYGSLFAVAALVLAPLASQAADPAKVHEYFQVMGLHKMMEDLLPAVTNNMTNTMRQANPNLPPDIGEIIGKVVSDTMRPLLPQMEASTEKIYADTLTDEEVDASIKFYKTPVGQSLLKKMPTLTAQGMQAGQMMMQQHLPEIQQRLIAEIQARHPELLKK